MKTLSFLTLAVAFSPALIHAQAQDDYMNWLRQIQTVETADGGVVEVSQDLYVEPNGTTTSPLGIPEGGAIFQLWTLNTVTNDSWLLDTDVVGSSRPAALITIESQDSYLGVARTRADIPFTVTTNYLNLQEAGEGVDSELTRVRSYHYLEGSSSDENSNVSSNALENANSNAAFLRDQSVTIVRDEVISQNGAVTQSNIYTQILPSEGEDAYKAKGLEHFAVETFSESSDESTVIATDKIEIFPLPTGELTNFGDEERWSALPESLGISVDGAYPGSLILFRVEITRASEDEGTPPTVVDLLHKNINELTEEDLNIQFSEYDLLDLKSNDQLNFQLISKTVFDERILSEEHRTLNFDIFVRAGINTLSE